MTVSLVLVKTTDTYHFVFLPRHWIRSTSIISTSYGGTSIYASNHTITYATNGSTYLTMVYFVYTPMMQKNPTTVIISTVNFNGTVFSTEVITTTANDSIVITYRIYFFIYLDTKILATFTFTNELRIVPFLIFGIYVPIVIQLVTSSVKYTG